MPVDNVSGQEGSMTEGALAALCARSIKKIDKGGDEVGYVFTRDIRHRIRSLYMMENHLVMEYIKRVKCPHLCIKAFKFDGLLFLANKF